MSIKKGVSHMRERDAHEEVIEMITIYSLRERGALAATVFVLLCH